MKRKTSRLRVILFNYWVLHISMKVFYHNSNELLFYFFPGRSDLDNLFCRLLRVDWYSSRILSQSIFKSCSVETELSSTVDATLRFSRSSFLICNNFTIYRLSSAWNSGLSFLLLSDEGRLLGSGESLLVESSEIWLTFCGFKIGLNVGFFNFSSLFAGTEIGLLFLLFGRDFCMEKKDEDSSDERADSGEEEEKSRTFLMKSWLTSYFSFSWPTLESTLVVEPLPFPAMVWKWVSVSGSLSPCCLTLSMIFLTSLRLIFWAGAGCCVPRSLLVVMELSGKVVGSLSLKEPPVTYQVTRTDKKVRRKVWYFVLQGSAIILANNFLLFNLSVDWSEIERLW